jgi:hypothetical protein
LVRLKFSGTLLVEQISQPNSRSVTVLSAGMACRAARMRRADRTWT